MPDPFIGEVRIFAGNFAPKGWALCDGQMLSISIRENQPLFSLLGTIYGGDGRTTFALPDLRGRAVVSFGQGPGLSSYQQGAPGGAEHHALTTQQLPSHSHAVHATETPSSSNPEGAVPAHPVVASASPYGAKPDGKTTMNSGMIGATGGGHPVSVMQPYLVMNYIIAVQRVFPSHN